jgi:hypothetical protein
MTLRLSDHTLRSTDLNDCDTPESVATVLQRAADKFRESVPELRAAWQDPKAGAVWDKLARALEVCAMRCDRICAQDGARLVRVESREVQS